MSSDPKLTRRKLFVDPKFPRRKQPRPAKPTKKTFNKTDWQGRWKGNVDDMLPYWEACSRRALAKYNLCRETKKREEKKPPQAKKAPQAKLAPAVIDLTEIDNVL